MKKSPSIIVLTAPLALTPGVGTALPAKFSGVAYSGGFVPGYGVVIDMETTVFAQKMPLLAQHDHNLIIGVINEGKKDGGSLSVSGVLFSDIPGSRAEQIAQFAQRGMPFQMSVGLYGYNEMYVQAGKSASVNGQEFQGPVTVLRDGKVREVSVVALGADPNTEAQFFNADSQKSSNSVEVISLSRTQLAAAAKRYIAAHPVVDFITAVKAIQAGVIPVPAQRLAVGMSRADIDASAKTHMAAHPGVDYVSAVKIIQPNI